MNSSLPEFGFSVKAKRTAPQPINYLISTALREEKLISLAAGLVDQETLPAEETARLSGELLCDEVAGKGALQYGATEGLAELREAVLAHVCKLDGVSAAKLAVTPDNVVIASGSQQLLYIIADILLDPGDIVITEWPSYFVFTGALVSLGADIRAVEMDDSGIKLDALDATLAELKRSGELKRVKIVYLCDYYQNPTGITLSAQRRKPLLDLIRSYSAEGRICLLEDAAYRELSCEEAAPVSIKSHEADNAQVVLAQTFSKPFAPGFRTGYAILPDGLVEPVLNQKGNHDFGSSNLAQHVLLRAMSSGVYEEHVAFLRQRYRAKRDAMLEALDEHLGDFQPDQTRWTRPGGGLYVYLSLPDWMDTGKDSPLFAAALTEGVMYVPGEFCYGPDPRRTVPSNHMRLTFGTVDVPAIREGVARLARAIKRVGGRAAAGAGKASKAQSR
jgi:2-aminoadipate transaminase